MRITEVRIKFLNDKKGPASRFPNDKEYPLKPASKRAAKPENWQTVGENRENAYIVFESAKQLNKIPYIAEISIAIKVSRNSSSIKSILLKKMQNKSHINNFSIFGNRTSKNNNNKLCPPKYLIGSRIRTLTNDANTA